MSRELKFRAWDGEQMGPILYMRLPVEANDDSGVVVMQWTGLVDRNGKEIYEGDIDGDLDREFGFRHVVYKDGAYGLQYGDDADSFDPFILWERVEVIGNIYEHPELGRTATETTE